MKIGASLMMNSLEMATSKNNKKSKISEQLLIFLSLIFQKIIIFNQIKFPK
jgi:hypothetical protein